MSAKGKKTALIYRILENDASESDECEDVETATRAATRQSGSQSELSQILRFMSEQQQENYKQQQEERKLLLQMIENLTNSNRSADVSHGGAAISAKAVLDKIEWKFEDIDNKLKQLDDQMDKRISGFSHEDSIRSAQIAIENLNKVIVNNLETFNEDLTIALQKRIRETKQRISNKKGIAIGLRQDEAQENQFCLQAEFLW